MTNALCLSRCDVRKATLFGFPAMEVGIETGKINKNKGKEKN
jgi:hypothetical protein